eukprot:7387162-Prymnesium_polylepis.1
MQPRCEVSLLHELDSHTIVGRERRVSFTACDATLIPVDHQLPTRSDPRRFNASCSVSAGATQPAQIEYVQDGIYDVLLALPLHGAFACALHLEGVEVSQLRGQASCPSERLPLLGGLCDCKAGHEATTDGTGCRLCSPEYAKASKGGETCEVCPEGKFQQAQGASACTLCPPGQHQQEFGAVSCRQCDAGHNARLPGSVRCDACDPGSVQPATGQKNCTACSAGKFQPRSGVVSCTPCPIGQASV